MSKFTIKMHTVVEDIYTGFQGQVVARCQYSTGCNQYCVQPRQEEGKNEYPESHFFDENRLKIIMLPVKLDKLPPIAESLDVKGGPQRDQPRSK
jgi:hypothetical protein